MPVIEDQFLAAEPMRGLLSVSHSPPIEESSAKASRVRREDLLITPHGDDGEYVVKDPLSGAYYHLGEEESFLLFELDGRRTPEQIRADYERRFSQALSEDDLDGFVALSDEMRLLAPAGRDDRQVNGAKPQAAYKQSILYWRRSFFDPDRLCNWLEPKIRFVWTRTFFIASAVAIAFAFGLMWVNRLELVSRFADAMSFQTLLLAWVTLVLATTCHEFAHGLTCKHYGGEVHEVGFLLIFFMPAFYCNVSDAWLFKEKSKRIWVTLAGGYCDLILWGGAIFVWRLSIQDSLINYLAWIVLSVCGVRIFFNFNPLLKLDGYYLLSDFSSVPNLRQRSWDTLMGHVRWALWGAPRPSNEAKRLYLFGFGAATWAYSLAFLCLMFAWMAWWLGEAWGPIGTLTCVALAVAVMRGQFSGVSSGEFMAMLKGRRVRVAAWGLIIAAITAVMVLVPLEEKASGTFQVRSTTRAEVRAPVAGFLREVNGDEGDRFEAGAVIARLEVPELNSKAAQKRAEIVESEAKLKLLKFGPRSGSAEQASETQIRSAEIDAEKARLDKLNEELKYLEERTARTLVRAAAAGVISTPHLKEKVGHFFQDGDLICLIEEPKSLEAQIDVPEQEAARVKTGQKVELKARSLPFDQLEAVVDRVAPSAIGPEPKEGKLQSTVPVYCKLANAPSELRPGMTGFARVSCGKRAMGIVLSNKALRYFRTEFWW